MSYDAMQCLGDQQAALVGQDCLTLGSAKNTFGHDVMLEGITQACGRYGTGCFLLYNTGLLDFNWGASLTCHAQAQSQSYPSTGC